MAKAILPIRHRRCLGHRYRNVVDDHCCLSYFNRSLGIRMYVIHFVRLKFVSLSVWLRQHLSLVNKKKEKCRDSIDTRFAR